MSGSRDLQNNKIVQVVALALKNTSTQKYLLAKRAKGSAGAGEWEFPGGKIEPGETSVQALIREINEELNYDLSGSQMQLLGQHFYEYPGKKIQISLWLVLTDKTPKFSLVDHDEVSWFEIEKIKEVNLSAGDKYFISLLK